MEATVTLTARVLHTIRLNFKVHAHVLNATFVPYVCVDALRQSISCASIDLL